MAKEKIIELFGIGEHKIKLEFLNQHAWCNTPADEYNQFMFDIEKIGRTCWKSESLIDTIQKTKKFCKNIMSKKHESVLEHCNLRFTFLTDRAMSHALVRHRHCAFTQESTHYIDYAKKKNKLSFVYPTGMNEKDAEIWRQCISSNITEYLFFYNHYGRDLSRSLLPTCLKTELTITTNLREWRHILSLRLAFDHPQMMALLEPVLKFCKQELPIFFNDITVGEN